MKSESKLDLQHFASYKEAKPSPPHPPHPRAERCQRVEASFPALFLMPLDLQSDSHRTWPEVLLGCRDGSIQGDVGTEVRVCGRLKWARLYILMKTTTLASVYLQTPINSWMRPPSARQRKWWGKLVSCCIHCSLLPTSFLKNTPHPHPPHPTSPEKQRAQHHEWGIVICLRHGGECFHFHLIRRWGC